ncbi:MAG: hypothetical protein IKB88_01250 [Clostridia bacterium]|nr:hypothetical protein [Clostridia bacterium]
MKKIISILLCVAIALSCCVSGASASEKNDKPVILISGFLCSQLFLNYNQTDEERVWILDPDKIFDYIGDNFWRFSKTLVGFAAGKTEEFGKTLGEGAYSVLGKLECNPDGSSVYPLSHYPNNPATSNVEYMLANGKEKNLYEVNMCKYLSGITDGSRVYCFQYDSRLDPVTIAGQLNDFIKEVKAYTGEDKVNIFCLSFGGMICTVYLYLYGENGDTDNVVMSVPAIGGTNIPDRLLRGNVDFDMETLVRFFETVLGSKSNFARIVEGSDFEGLEAVISSAGDRISDIVRYWGSVWALCSDDAYEKLKKDFLDPVASKNIIEKCDLVHNEIMPNLSKIYNKCREKGIRISLLCGTGSSLALGGGINGDVVLPAQGVSGALTAPLGSRFPDGYKGRGTTCNNAEHNHISPSMEVDASTAYLPENTWFVDEHYHGQYYYEEYTRSLVTKLLLTDEIKDIYSDPDYPQFECSNHAYRTIHAKFNNSRTGYLTSDDTALVVENNSTDCSILILSVVSNGVELDFDSGDSGIIKSGEKAEIPFEGKVPKVGRTAAEITVSYLKLGSLNPVRTSKFDVMIDNGDAPLAKEGFVEAGFRSRLQDAVPEALYNFLVKHSMRQFAECICNGIISIG